MATRAPVCRTARPRDTWPAAKGQAGPGSSPARSPARTCAAAPRGWAERGASDIDTVVTRQPGGFRDRSVSRPPAQDQDVGVAGRVVRHQVRDALGDAIDLGLAQPRHLVVVVGVVGEVAGDVGLLDASDAVLQAGGARDSPWPS